MGKARVCMGDMYGKFKFEMQSEETTEGETGIDGRTTLK
jgi:hypothetical protein